MATPSQRDDTPQVIVHDDDIEVVLPAHRQALGAFYEAYRGHVYRVLNFSLCLVARLAPATPDIRPKLGVAAAFHDLGVWSDATWDYLPPSIRRMRAYLTASARASWSDELSVWVEMHHKLRPYRGPGAGAVEAFRRADLADFPGWRRFGMPAAWLSEVRRTWPDHGFRRGVAVAVILGALRRPWRPLPMVRW